MSVPTPPQLPVRETQPLTFGQTVIAVALGVAIGIVAAVLALGAIGASL